MTYDALPHLEWVDFPNQTLDYVLDEFMFAK